MDNIYQLGKILKEHNLTIATAESCTAGAIGARIASISGASNYFIGGAIVYSSILKEKILGVSKDTIENYGVVSEPTVEEMNIGARRLTGADIAISITGYAGETGGDEFAQNGTVWLCVGNNVEMCSKRLMLCSDRTTNLKDAVDEAIALTLDFLCTRYS